MYILLNDADMIKAYGSNGIPIMLMTESSTNTWYAVLHTKVFKALSVYTHFHKGTYTRNEEKIIWQNPLCDIEVATDKSIEYLMWITKKDMKDSPIYTLVEELDNETMLHMLPHINQYT